MPIHQSMFVKYPLVILNLLALLSLLQVETVNAQFKPTTQRELRRAILTIPNRRLRRRAQPIILRYALQSTKPALQDGLRVLLKTERHLQAKYRKLKKQISRIVIDGSARDWKNLDLLHTDLLNDSTEIDTDETAGVAQASDDLKRWGLIVDEKFIYGFFEPVVSPRSGEEYHYRINLFNDKWEILYAIVWTSSSNVIQEWDGQGNFVRYLSLSGVSFAKGQVFEARLPRRLLPGLLFANGIQAVVWHEFKNRVDSHTVLPGALSLKDSYRNTSVELLAQYAKRGALEINDPLPVALALTDGYLYKRADISLKEEIVTDGVGILNEAKTSQNYSFPGQEKLTDLSLEALLFWANRMVIYGGYGDLDYYMTSMGRFNQAAYHFLAVQPETLRQARELIIQLGLLDQDDLEATVKNIQQWLWSINKYRRYYFSAIEEMYRNNPDNPSIRQIYEESLYELQHNLTDVTEVNGVPINKGTIFSPSFQIPYAAQNGLFYGNCVDVAAMAITIYKSLGITAFPIAYGSVNNGIYNEYHTIAYYYSSLHRQWLNFEVGTDSSALLSDDLILTQINRPQIGAYWSLIEYDLGPVKSTLSSRITPQLFSNQDWNLRYQQGYSHAEVRELVLPDKY